MLFLDTKFHVLEFDKLYDLRDGNLPRHSLAGISRLAAVRLPYDMQTAATSHQQASVPYLHHAALSDRRLSAEGISSFGKLFTKHQLLINAPDKEEPKMEGSNYSAVAIFI